MTCKDCVSYKPKPELGEGKGICTSAWLSDATPPANLKSKKKIKEWLNSDGPYERVNADDENCRHYQWAGLIDLYLANL